jgi:hypothetical protein
VLYRLLSAQLTLAFHNEFRTPGPSEMRHSCLFVAISLALLTLSGCRVESGGDSTSTRNPATNVDLRFSTFTLLEQTDTVLFADLIQAVEPDPNTQSTFDAAAVADSIRNQIALFAGLTYSDEQPPQIESARNPLDIIRRVIGENAVENFNEGRQYIVRRIKQGEAGEYSNRTNQVQIRFIDESALKDGQPENDYNWQYPIVKWVYTPESSNLVTRVLTWASSGSFPPGSTRPSATLATQFLPEAFSSSGYNDGARVITEGSVVIENEREMAFARSYSGSNTDSLIIDGTAIGTSENTEGGPEFTFAGQIVDCVKIEMDYELPKVRVYTSIDQTPSTDAYCSEKTEPEYEYATKESGLRP